MNHTPNFHLNLPEGTDKVNISDLNENFSIIDSNMGKLTVRFSFSEETGAFVADTSSQDILAALNNGTTVVGMLSMEGATANLNIAYYNPEEHITWFSFSDESFEPVIVSFKQSTLNDSIQYSEYQLTTKS